jgi:hypothetical protein
MKTCLLLLFLLLSATLFSQELKEKQIHKLYRLGLDTTGMTQLSAPDYAQLHAILQRQHQHTGTLIPGIIFGSLSAFSLTTGILMLTQNSGYEGEDIAHVLGAIMVTGGVVDAAISIPLLVVSKKRKKQRNKRIENYRRSR